MRRDGYALLMVLGLALTVGLAAALMSVRMAQEADQSRLEAEKALAQVQLDGRHNELLLRLAGAFREEVRGLLEAQNTRGRFAFGSGGSAPDQSSVSTAMQSLRQALQTRADALRLFRKSGEAWVSPPVYQGKEYVWAFVRVTLELLRQYPIWEALARSHTPHRTADLRPNTLY